jgi:hypothetical protein
MSEVFTETSFFTLTPKTVNADPKTNDHPFPPLRPARIDSRALIPRLDVGLLLTAGLHQVEPIQVLLHPR